MNVRYRALVALGAGVLCLAPAAARATTPPGAGTPCEMALLATGGTAAGTVWDAGWTSAGPGTSVGDTVTVRCSIQYGASPANTDLFSTEATGRAEASVPPTPVALPVSASAVLYLCTEITLVHDGGSTVYEYDADGDDTNGPQCAAATRTPTPGGDVIVVSGERALYCIRLTDDTPEPICVWCGPDISCKQLPKWPPF